MWHKPCRTFHPWCLCIKTRCLSPTFLRYYQVLLCCVLYEYLEIRKRPYCLYHFFWHKQYMCSFSEHPKSHAYIREWVSEWVSECMPACVREWASERAATSNPMHKMEKNMNKWLHLLDTLFTAHCRGQIVHHKKDIYSPVSKWDL